MIAVTSPGLTTERGAHAGWYRAFSSARRREAFHHVHVLRSAGTDDRTIEAWQRTRPLSACADQCASRIQNIIIRPEHLTGSGKAVNQTNGVTGFGRCDGPAVANAVRRGGVTQHTASNEREKV